MITVLGTQGIPANYGGLESFAEERDRHSRASAPRLQTMRPMRFGELNAWPLLRAEPSTRRRVRAALAWSLAVVLAACGDGGPNSTNGDETTPTPVPTGRDAIAAICDATGKSIRNLDRQLVADVTAATLTDQGTIIAMMTGVIASDMQRLRSIADSGDPGPSTRWMSALGEAVTSGTSAVRASAAGDVAAFTAARAEMVDRREFARSIADDLGYRGCWY